MKDDIKPKRKKPRETVCKKCGTYPKLSCSFDRHFCQKCDIWIEYKPCGCAAAGERCYFRFPPDKRPSKCGELDVVNAMCCIRNNRTKFLKEEDRANAKS